MVWCAGGCVLIRVIFWFGLQADESYFVLIFDLVCRWVSLIFFLIFGLVYRWVSLNLCIFWFGVQAVESYFVLIFGLVCRWVSPNLFNILFGMQVGES